MHESLKEWVAAVQDRVHYCINCQPWDKGPVWILGSQCELDWAMEDLGVPEAFRDDVAERIRCPSCGSEDFDRWSDFGEKTAAEKEADNRWEEWYEEYQPRVNEFAEHLQCYPYLGASHPIGREILGTISSFPKTRIVDQDWWRARRPEGAQLFQPADMFPPPAERAQAEGRFSHYGQSVFYLAEVDQAALIEVLTPTEGEGFGWVQEFHISDAGEILDLRTPFFAAEDLSIPVLALGLIDRHLPDLLPDAGSAWKPEYFVPRFIADSARAAGFSGITFASPKHYYANLVFFEWSDMVITAKGEPRLVRLTLRPLNEIDPGF